MHIDQRERGRIILSLLMPLAAGVFLLGIGWGLPSSNVDPFLFGGQPVWSGGQILDLAGNRFSSAMGADVDMNPIVRGNGPIVLNETNRQRAEIIRRYRLFTYQPDEMITMMALASIKPGRREFDPQLYQYGGLWIYPVGAALKVVSKLEFLKLVPEQDYYLEHPEAFGNFYVVARLYTVFWALIGVWAVFRLALNAGGQLIGATAASILYIFLPVVVNMSHEAKPHLPGAVLTMLAALAAGKFVHSGKHRWWIIAALLCGAATGMVLSAAVALAIPLLMVVMCQMPWRRRLAILGTSLGIAVFVYFLTNPYVLIHLLRDRSLLVSNLGNSAQMYQERASLNGVLNAARLIVQGTGPMVALAGVVGLLVLTRHSGKPQAAGLRILRVILLLLLIPFAARATGKPGEYARFAILPDIILAIAAAVMLGRWEGMKVAKFACLGLLIGLTILPSLIYLRGFRKDSGELPRRMEYAQVLSNLHKMGATSIGVQREPAPYSLPPIDLFSWKLLLLPENFSLETDPAAVDVIVRPVDELSPPRQTMGEYVQVSERVIDDLFPSRISWANKPMEIWVKRDLPARQWMNRMSPKLGASAGAESIGR